MFHGPFLFASARPGDPSNLGEESVLLGGIYFRITNEFAAGRVPTLNKRALRR
jgi:hypothetical protein